MKRQRSDYKICPFCGATLDLDEKCDCIRSEGFNNENQIFRHNRRFARHQSKSRGFQSAAGDHD